MIITQRISGLEVHSCKPSRPLAGAPPLVFIHGAFAGGWMWVDTLLPALAEAGYHGHALSLRGHGGSDGHDEIDWHSIAHYVDDVESIIAWLGGDVVLIGHSMGGFVAQKILERRHVAGVALVCSVPPQGLVAAQFHLMLAKPGLFLELNRILGGNHTDTLVLREALFAGEVPEAMLQRWLGQMQRESHRAIWDMSMFSLPNLSRMARPPMLILGAEKDLLVPAFLVQSTAHAYGLPCHIFRGMGHAVSHEKEWPLVAAALREWLDALRP